MNVLLIGASGATGKDLLEILLRDESISKIDIFVRRDLHIKNEKLKVHVIDFDKPEQWSHLVKGDVLFSCLGTTLKAAGSKEAQTIVDYNYQLNFAKSAKENNVICYVLVSSDFASTKSRFYYPKMKGQLEEDVKILGFPKLIIFNPPMLLRKNSDRKTEVIANKVIKFINSIGLFKSSKPLSTELLAMAMVKSIKTFNKGEYSIKGQDILKYV